MPAKDPVLTPELIKILKIFGLGSILLVITLSFFDSHRASNSGEDLTFRVSDSARLYFLNLKAINYDREIRKDAGMTLYRHNGFLENDSVPGLHLIIIINPLIDEGYIYLEPVNLEFPFFIKKAGSDASTIELVNGNKFDHLNQLEAILPWIESEAKLELVVKDQKIPLWQSESEKDALKSTLEDYFRLLQD
ncbi:hypothetical protein [Algoriphagus hitonicola]|uniref:Uncharacterized protein n=1 Tax=Algoriphagus hitonicola TaxID=435880 RepID=A0A1I2SHL8_9BACT|nr:hypothetical protein [Algoriphagus hitonicola]SFG52288.1 hypothetical protein SAMN04487988_104287 [Algoriphagus hitonicola]